MLGYEFYGQVKCENCQETYYLGENEWPGRVSFCPYCGHKKVHLKERMRFSDTLKDAFPFLFGERYNVRIPTYPYGRFLHENKPKMPILDWEILRREYYDDWNSSFGRFSSTGDSTFLFGAWERGIKEQDRAEKEHVQLIAKWQKEFLEWWEQMDDWNRRYPKLAVAFYPADREEHEIALMSLEDAIKATTRK